MKPNRIVNGPDEFFALPNLLLGLPVRCDITARTEDLVTLKAGITRMLNENWLMLVEYYYSDNDSSDSTFSYDRNRITLSLIRTF